MKKSILLASLVFLVAAPAFAVRTAQCPKSITFTAARLNVTKSLTEVMATARERAGLEGEGLRHVATSYSWLKGSPTVTTVYKLGRAQNGRCDYWTQEPLEDRITLWTEQGRDRLFAQKTVAPRGIMVRFQADVVSYGVDHLKLAEVVPMMLAVPHHPYTSFRAGGPLIPLGFANQVVVTVR